MSESMSENNTQRRRTCMHPLSSAQLSSGSIPNRNISAASTASQVDAACSRTGWASELSLAPCAPPLASTSLKPKPASIYAEHATLRANICCRRLAPAA